MLHQLEALLKRTDGQMHCFCARHAPKMCESTRERPRRERGKFWILGGVWPENPPKNAPRLIRTPHPLGMVLGGGRTPYAVFQGVRPPPGLF